MEGKRRGGKRENKKEKRKGSRRKGEVWWSLDPDLWIKIPEAQKLRKRIRVRFQIRKVS
jgi:hypothetical protein